MFVLLITIMKKTCSTLPRNLKISTSKKLTLRNIKSYIWNKDDSHEITLPPKRKVQSSILGIFCWYIKIPERYSPESESEQHGKQLKSIIRWDFFYFNMITLLHEYFCAGIIFFRFYFLYKFSLISIKPLYLMD